MGYIVANFYGDIIAYSGSSIPQGIFIGDDLLFNQITAEPHNCKWVDDQLITSQRPSVYHKWAGTDWVIDVEALSSSKLSQWGQIKALRDERLEYGGFPVGSYWFHSDVYAQSNYTDLLMMGTSIPSNLMWKTMSGAFVLMTPTLARQILAAKSQQKSLTFVKAEQHRAEMEASSDPLNYDFTTGWPPIFGE